MTTKMLNTQKENALRLIVESRLEKIANEKQIAEFWLYYRNNPPKNLSFESLAILFKKCAEYSSIEIGLIDEIINDVSISFRESNLIERPSIKLDSYIENITYFYDYQPFFFDEQEIFWFWNDALKKYEIVDETDLMNELDSLLGLEGQTVNAGIKRNYIEAFKRVGRLRKPAESKKHWIQFKDKAFSLRSSNLYDVKPNYFFTNPIPYKIGETTDTPILDKLFKEWVGEKYVQTLYEIIAYCCYQDIPIQVLFCFYGIGRNGKSSLLKIIKNFIGQSNICSTELDLIAGEHSSRFETFKMYKKLVCFMGETNFGILSRSSIIKKLTGGDMIGFEMKNKKPFDDYTYAKLIIASNSLPTSEDTSDGFYRRWVILDFPNQFPEGQDIVTTIPEKEYENLAKKVTLILPGLLQRGFFTGHSDFNVRKEKYIMASNPLTFFIKEHLVFDSESYIRFSEFYNKYSQYLKSKNRRIVSRKEFRQVLDMEGIECRRTSKKIGDSFQNDTWIEGYKFCERCESYSNFPTQLKDIHKGSEEFCRTFTTNTKTLEIEEDVVSNDIDSPTDVVINKCKHHPNGWVVTSDFENTVKYLLTTGVVFEVKPGVIKLLS